MRLALFKKLSGIFLCAFLAVTLHAQQSGKRVALIIGNDAYTVSPLKNAVNDARLVDQALKTSGFQTMLVENARKADLDRVVGEFLDKIGPDDTALFYYAGHGVQIENENFLVPVDFTPGATISAAKFACMSMAQILDELKRKRAKKNIIILDACRTNPVQSKYSLEGGLAKPQDLPRESFIAFSTGPGQTAADNPNGRNSWFTEALADYVSQPTLTLELNDVLTRVKKRVADATEGHQTPWTTTTLTSAFYFHLPANPDAADTTMLEKWLGDALTRESRGEWAEAAGLVERILQKKPGGRLEDAARKKLPYLVARRDAQARFDAADYVAAGGLGRQALQADPFAISAAMQSVNSYLVADRVPEAVEMLKAMRARGDSASVETANRMLKDLSAASPEAVKELAAAPAPPPSIEEMFPDVRFGVTDQDYGKRYLADNPVSLVRWTKDLKMEVAMPASIVAAAPAPDAATAQVVPAAEPAPVTAAKPIDIFHLEVIPTAETRNLRIRKPAGADEFGYVEFSGPSSPIVFDGNQLVLPTKLKVPAGKYEVRSVDAGKVVNTQEIEVKPLSIQTYQVKRP